MAAKKRVTMSRDRLTATYHCEKDVFFHEFSILGLIYKIPGCEVRDAQFACVTDISYDTEWSEMQTLGYKFTYHEETANPTRNCYEFRKVSGNEDEPEDYFAHWKEDTLPALELIQAEIDEKVSKHKLDEAAAQSCDAIDRMIASVRSGNQAVTDTTTRTIEYLLSFMDSEITMVTRFGSTIDDWDVTPIQEIAFTFKDGERSDFRLFVKVFTDIEEIIREDSNKGLPVELQR